MVIRFMLIISVAVLSVGCDTSDTSSVVAEGIVTVDGKLLSGATITFEPINATGGPNASTAVLNGRFAFDESASLRAGTYRVRVAMIPAEILAAFPPEQQSMLPPKDSVVSPAFDTHSTLTCTLLSDQTNELLFEVEFL